MLFGTRGVGPGTSGKVGGGIDLKKLKFKPGGSCGLFFWLAH